MKKRILLLLSLFLLWGCQSTPSKTLSQPVTLSFFYTQTCPVCKAFKKEAIPYLEKVFGNSLTIEMYDIDEDATKPKYDGIIDSLVDFDHSEYGYGPFYAVEGYFAKLGYTAGDEEYLADDIERAVNHETLSDELSGLRYIYKES
jgi:thiol-disulfide isomerase/thioredoxin